MTAAVEIQRASGFDDAAVSPERWEALLRRGDTDEVFLTHAYQRAWWESFGRGELILLLAARAGETVALASLFADQGMVYFVGAGGSDYLDFIGDTSDPTVLPALLAAAREAAPGFLGFVFHHLPDSSATAWQLRAAAERLELVPVDQGTLPAPAMTLASGVGEAAARKKSLLRHESGLRRSGVLEVRTRLDCAEAQAALEVLFEQHIERWAPTAHPSLFLDPLQKAFYRRLVAAGGPAGWLRLTRVDWNGEPVAVHLGFHHRRRYLWYKPSFAVAHARRSPGEVLLRHLILAAIEEGAETFDFGLGDEAFKARFATCVRRVETWGPYPRAAS